MPLIGGKDPEAFEVFYDRHGGAACSLAYRIFDGLASLGLRIQIPEEQGGGCPMSERNGHERWSE